MSVIKYFLAGATAVGAFLIATSVWPNLAITIGGFLGGIGLPAGPALLLAGTPIVGLIAAGLGATLVVGA